MTGGQRVQTIYLLWPAHHGRVMLGVWDGRVFNQDVPVREQLHNAMFFDEMTVGQCLGLGASFVNIGVATSGHFVNELREAKLAELASQVKPASEEELAKMSAFINGLVDVDLSLPGNSDSEVLDDGGIDGLSS